MHTLRILVVSTFVLSNCSLASKALASDHQQSSFVSVHSLEIIGAKLDINTEFLNRATLQLYTPGRSVYSFSPTKLPQSHGLLTILSNSQSFFNIEYTRQLSQSASQILNNSNFFHSSKFDSLATSNMHLKEQNLYLITCRSYFAIVSILSVGCHYKTGITYEELLSLIASCPASGSAEHKSGTNSRNCSLKVSKRDGKLHEVYFKDEFEESIATYDTGVESSLAPCSAVIDIKCKQFPTGIRVKFAKQQTITDPNEVIRIYDSIISKIPHKTKLLAAEDPIYKEWTGRSFEPILIPEVIQEANEQRMANMRSGWSTYLVVSLVVIVVFGLLIFWFTRKRSAAAMVFFALSVGSANAQTADGPYCGIYCVTAAAAAMERKVDFLELRQRKYLSANPGSTTDDLIEALKLAKLKGISKTYLSVSQLRLASGPVILHARSPGTKNFKHWILFLGFTEYGKVSIYDPPFAQQEISLAELLAVWDGFGVEVVDQDASSIPIVSLDWIALTLVAGLGYVALRRKCSPALAIPAVALVIGIVWGLSPHGILNKPNAVGLISANYFPREIPEVGYEEFQQCKTQDQGLLIDARDYDSHMSLRIPDTMNVPVNAGLMHLHNSMKDVPRDRKLICFCNSERCGWADSVANQLMHMGYQKVAVYRGGISDWIQHKQPVIK